jgi:serine/threonine protein kinase
MTEPLEPNTPQAKILPEPADPPVIPDHELIRLIGSGSSGQVWLARNALHTYRAVKIVYQTTFRHKRPFEREFNGIQKFEPISRLHDGLVDILQVGRNDAEGYFYCVMELADDVATGQTIVPEQYSARTLAHDLARYKRLPIADCVQLGAAIASALSFLHKHGLIHRDIKPSNIVFVNGIPKLADIGLVAEMSEARSYVGTEGFIPPEGPGTVSADIYSLGKVLYEISTGQDRNDYPELPTQLGDSVEDQMIIQFNKIVLKACRTGPRQRYQSAEDMAEALREFRYDGRALRRKINAEQWINVIGIVGFLVAAGVFTTLILRLIDLLKHPR